MGRQAPEGLLGIHLNLLVTAPGGSAIPAETEEERAALEQTETFRTSGFGYFLEQATRPQTRPHLVAVGGMPGWQITLVAVGAALLAATVAVILDRARTIHRHAAANIA